MITLDNRYPSPIDTAPLGHAARLALENQSAPEHADLSIVLGDDDLLRQLNLDFRDVDAPTDVLSFPAEESDPETGAPYLGDVIISVERALEQSRTGGHSLEAELQLLIVHGILHLLGHDHAEPEEKRRMWDAQAAVLAQLGLSGIRISE